MRVRLDDLLIPFRSGNAPAETEIAAALVHEIHMNPEACMPCRLEAFTWVHPEP